MICANGIDEIQVKAKNGKPSLLFEALLKDAKGDVSTALENYAMANTPEFLNWYKGELDENGEPVFKEGFLSEGNKKYFYQKASASTQKTKTQELIDSARLNIRRKIKIYEQNPNLTDENERSIEKLDALSEKLVNLKEQEAVIEYLRASSSSLAAAKHRFDNLQAEIATGNSKKTKAEMMNELHQIKAYVSDYTIAIQMAYNYQAFASIDPNEKAKYDLYADANNLSLENIIKDISINGGYINSTYLIIARDLITESLFSEKEFEAVNEELKAAGKPQVTKESFKKELEISSRDVDVYSRWFSSPISINDVVLATFAKKIKSLVDIVRRNSINTEAKIDRAKKKYEKESGISSMNIKAFNDPFYQEVETINESGEKVKRLVFLDKIDWVGFESEKKRRKLDKDAKLKEAEKNIKDVDILDQTKRKINFEYTSWVSQNYDKVREVPYEKFWKNKKYALLEQNKPAFEYYNVLKEVFENAKESLPRRYRNNQFLPSIRREQLDRLSEGDWRSTWKEVKSSFGSPVRSTDTEYGILNIEGQEYKTVPVFYHNELEASETSYDLYRSMTLYAKMADNYKQLTSIQSEVDVFTDVINSRNAAKTTSTGSLIAEGFAKRIGIERFINKSDEPRFRQMFQDYMSAIYYGENKAQENPTVLKWSNLMTKYVAQNSLAMNVYSAVNNLAYGQIQNLIESIGSKYYSASDYRAGMSTYFSNSAQILADVGKASNKSKLTLVSELFEFRQGFRDYSVGDKSNAVKTVLGADPLMVLQNIGEHSIGYGIGLAYLNATKLKTKSGQTINLLEAYEKDGDSLKFRTDLELSNAELEKVQKKAQEQISYLFKKLQGNYTQIDSVPASRYVMGRFALLFRKHLYTNIKRRWGWQTVNYEAGVVEEGSYRQFFRAVFNTFGKVYKLDGAGALDSAKGIYSGEAKKALYEIGAALVIMTTLGLLWDDDDDDEAAFFRYNLTRLSSDLLFYVNPFDMWRTAKNPTSAIGTINKVLKFGRQLFDPFEEYERKEGTSEKGDNKLLRKAEDIIPVITQIENLLTPEEQLSAFQKLSL